MAFKMPSEFAVIVGFSGATRRIRTDDLLITNKLEDPNTGRDREQSSTTSRKSGE
jgi:hypothetical protein